MSDPLIPIITQSGLQAVLNATHDGLQAKITEIAVGEGAWSPTESATALKQEQHRIPVSNGRRLQPTQLHITAVDSGNKAFWVREVGFYLEDGTLFAIWSHPTQALAWKAAGVDLLLAFDLMLSALPADSLTFDGTGGLNLAPATVTEEGIVRLATPAEALAGRISKAVVMTPATSRAQGDKRYARLDHRHHWKDLQGKPSRFPAESHHHDDRYLLRTRFKVTSGYVATTKRLSGENYIEHTWTRNCADVAPPAGYTLDHLLGFTASIGMVYFGGDVNERDTLFVRWRKHQGKIRVICGNNTNRGNLADIGSFFNYLAIWMK